MFLKLLNKVPLLATIVKNWLHHSKRFDMEDFEKYLNFFQTLPLNHKMFNGRYLKKSSFLRYDVLVKYVQNLMPFQMIPKLA